MADTSVELISPDWPAPAGIRAVSTTRGGGVSGAPYASLNLGSHVGDRADAVLENRAILRNCVALPEAPRWLDQVHGVDIVRAETVREPISADGSITADVDVVCAVLTADCVPVLMCDRGGEHVAAVHGGWRGLAAGVLETAVRSFVARGVSPADILCWLGPAIGPRAYAVGPEVRDALMSAGDAVATAGILTPGSNGRWALDLYQLASSRLRAAGVAQIFGGDICTHADPARFFSYRRDGLCGRQATLIWRQY